MKKIIALTLIAALMLFAAGCQQTVAVESPKNSSAPTAAASVSASAAASQPSAASDADGIKIGIFMPLTGPSSLMGTAGNNAAIMATDEINAAGGILGKKLTLISYDDKSSPEEAVKNVTRMLEVDKVNAIVGSLHSGNIQACGEIVEKAKIPLIGTGTSPQWLQKGWTYLFRSTLNTFYSSQSAVQICKTLNLKKMAIFHSQDEYGKNGKDNMTKLCAENGIDIVAVESMKPGDTDFTAQCSNIAASKPDVVYIIATTDNLPQMVKQTRANGYDSYIVGEQSLGMPEVKEIAGAGADKIVFGACYTMPINSPDEASTPELVKFFTDYKSKFGQMCPSEVAGRCYDGMYILKKGFEDANSTDGTAVRDAILKISDFKGLQGTFNFVGKNGEGLTESRLYITMGGKDILIDDYLKTK
jgi:branched-chain amino acid transport system substrate-binding protein